MHTILHLPSNFLSLFSNALTLTRAVHMCMSEEPCTGACGTYHVSHSKERWIFPFPGSHQLSIAPQLQTAGVSLLIYPGKFIVWLDFVWVIRRQPQCLWVYECRDSVRYRNNEKPNILGLLLLVVWVWFRALHMGLGVLTILSSWVEDTEFMLGLGGHGGNGELLLAM